MRKILNSPRICYIASPELFSRGAYGVHAMEMCKAFAKLGVEFEAVVPGSFETDKIFKCYGVEKPFNLKSLPFTKHKGRQLSHGLAAAFHAFSNRRNFDLVVTRNIICTSILTAMGIATVYDAHHPPVNTAARLLFKSFQNSRSLAAVSFNSEGLRRIYLRDGLAKEKTIVAHNGVETENFENRPPQASIRKQLNLPADKKIVCYCGNTYAGRGIESLLDIAKETKDAFFLIVGGRDEDNAPYIEAARKKALDNFVMKGFVPHTEVPAYLLASDLLVLPYTEHITIKGGINAAEFTSPMKLFEYMAAGKPIVATAIPSVADILKDGENCVMTAPGDTRGFGLAVRRCLDDEGFSEKIGSAARQKAGEYTWEDRVSKILLFASSATEKIQ
ncbi:MAG: glycosyltransferase [Candidatus Mycalebacterium zealandia]|nr:MAG: glycosyltransferase [Candidatus Mycalebacterium zealandia]